MIKFYVFVTVWGGGGGGLKVYHFHMELLHILTRPLGLFSGGDWGGSLARA